MSHYREPDKEALQEKADRERDQEAELEKFTRDVSRSRLGTRGLPPPKPAGPPSGAAAVFIVLLKIFLVGIGLVGVLGVVLVGLILFTCSRH